MLGPSTGFLNDFFIIADPVGTGSLIMPILQLEKIRLRFKLLRGGGGGRERT